MIVLRANPELKLTFEKLIQTMKVPVIWNGLLVAVDNYLILQGRVRSLFFHFDSRKVVTNIIELTIKEDDIKDTSENTYVRNVINMILYAFGKWGTIKGLKVEKNDAQLNQLFSVILREINIQPDYTKDYYRFYRKGIRITYEDVIQAALEAVEKETEIPEEKQQGLWHKLVWKKMTAAFPTVETTLLERQKNRIGRNFYLTSYLCPFCKKKLHMAVYPEKKEFQIETVEGGVIIARAYTCQNCCSFYTPRPGRLLAEGDVYDMDFEGDRVAYEDYQELLGKNGERVSNYNFNRYVNKQRGNARETEQEVYESENEMLEETELDTRLRKGKHWKGIDFSKLSDLGFRRITSKIEEGFYPDHSVEKVEEKVHEQKKVREEKAAREKEKEEIEKYQKKAPKQEEAGQRGKQRGVDGRIEKEKAAEEERRGGFGGRREEAEQKYRTRIGQFKRLSDRQRSELLHKIDKDKELDETTRKQLKEELGRQRQEENFMQLKQKANACQDKSYAVIQKVYKETEEADLPEEERSELLERLDGLRKKQGAKEVKRLVEEMPKTLDRKGYQDYLEKIRSYEGVDTAPYEEKLKAGESEAEVQEIASMVKRARKISRDDYIELLGRLREQNFLPELLAPYEEKIKEKIRAIDQEAIERLCGKAAEMPYEEAENAYRAIKDGPFLPELKVNALKALEKRLAKIKTDECELLVQKLKSALKEAGMPEHPKHYFYPARKVLANQAEKSETDVIDFAVASYGAGIGKFEYPIFVVDTTRSGKADKGMFLTPENLYYSNLMTSYHISVFDIESIQAVGGLLSRGVYAYKKNGDRIKLPYAVEPEKLPELAEVLDGFVKYLQEKPFSRKETYLAQEQHDTICCFRCGYIYKGGNICPKCGYKMNE